MIVLTLVIIRIALPFIILHFANKSLADMDGYYGYIYDVDLSIIRGAYRIDSLYLNKVDTATQKQTPFFSASHIDLSVEWQALLHGSLVGEITLVRPALVFTKDKVEPARLIQDSTYFRKMLNKSMPLKINRLEVKHGILRYIDKGSNPPVDIEMNEVNMLAQNLHNSYDSVSLLPSQIKATAAVYNGTFDLMMRLNPLNTETTFDMNVEVKNTDLKKLNDFFQAYAKVDVNSGVFGLYAEAAAKEGKYAGYFKPIIKNLDLVGNEDRNDNILRKLWEGLAGTMGQIFKNQANDQIATVIPFEGSTDEFDTNMWYAIMNIFKNAFIQAIVPAIDNEINIDSVNDPKKVKKTLLQKLFRKNRKVSRQKK
jgi:hypothetical protein